MVLLLNAIIRNSKYAAKNYTVNDLTLMVLEQLPKLNHLLLY